MGHIENHVHDHAETNSSKADAQLASDLLFDIYGLYIDRQMGNPTKTAEADLKRDLAKVQPSEAKEVAERAATSAHENADKYPYVDLTIMTKDLMHKIDPKDFSS